MATPTMQAALASVAFTDRAGKIASPGLEPMVPGSAPPCSVETVGGSERTVIASSLDPQRATVLTLTKSTDPKTGAITLRRSIARAGQVLMTEVASLRGARQEVTVDFGAGFRGIQKLTTTSDGKEVRTTIDGRALTALVKGADPATARFLDGRPAPLTAVDGTVTEAIAQIERQAQGQMSSCVAKEHPQLAAGDLGAFAAGHQTGSLEKGSLVEHDFESSACNFFCGLGGDACGCCQDCCQIPYAICSVGAVTGLAACVAAAVAAAVPTVGVSTVAIAGCTALFAIAGGSCLDGLAGCDGSCETSSACCGPQCSEGTTSQGCGYPHCSSGATCCGGDMCCDRGADCCGNTCLEGVFSNDKCVDPTKGVFCEKSAGQECGPGCCPESSPVCRAGPPQQLCCETGAGDVCASGTKCCPSGSPKCLDDQCCGTTDVICGTGEACCPQPGICAGNTCCNPPDEVCGSSCCGSDQTCTPKRDICCGGQNVFGSVLCGDDCCTGDEVCQNGACCPSSQACGDTCCPAGQGCLNGQCSGCPTGQATCQRGTESPILCCDVGATCCADQCCPLGLVCLGTTCGVNQ